MTNEEILLELDFFARLLWVVDYKRLVKYFSYDDLVKKCEENPVLLMELHKIQEIKKSFEKFKSEIPLDSNLYKKATDLYSILINQLTEYEFEVRAILIKNDVKWTVKESFLTIHLDQFDRDENTLGEISLSSSGIVKGRVIKKTSQPKEDFIYNIINMTDTLINRYFE